MQAIKIDMRHVCNSVRYEVKSALLFDGQTEQLIHRFLHYRRSVAKCPIPCWEGRREAGIEGGEWL